MNEEQYDQLAKLVLDNGHRAVPMYHKDSSGKLALVGTGLPILYRNIAMLATATHVYSYFRDQQIIVAGSEQLLKFPTVGSGFAVAKQGDIDIDLAVLALPVIAYEELKRYCTFTDLTEFGSVSEQNKLTFYSLVGYPCTKNRVKQSELIWANSFFYMSTSIMDIAETKDSSKTEFTHFSLHYDLRKVAGKGSWKMQAPKPQGISGCGVWKTTVDQRTGALSKPELVGIGIEYIVRSKLFVVSRTEPLIKAISELSKYVHGEVDYEQWFTLRYN